MATIDKRAEIHPSAKIGKNVTIGPWTYIGPEVEIGDGTWIGPHVVIAERTRIGQNNKIFQYCALGEEPQHLDYKGEPTFLEIGDNNVFREFCSVSRGTVKGGGFTRIGNHIYMMAYAHLGHDCIVGDHVMLINHATLAGHVIVKNYAMIGAFVAVHQHVIIGAYSFTSRACMVSNDVLPYIIVCGHNAASYGLNLVGLKRRGFNSDTIKKLQHAYRIIFRRGLVLNEVLSQLEAMVTDCPEIQMFIDGIKNSKRGFIRRLAKSDEPALAE